LLKGQPLKWQHLVKDGVSLPTKWPKAEYENYMNASQKIRSKLRKDNKPESEMNALKTTFLLMKKGRSNPRP
jgi:hypothetical protein